MALRQGFWTHHAHQSLPDFHIAMSMLNRHAIQTIALAPLPCTRIAEAEAILLNLWRDLALARQERANATIALLVTADHGTALCRCMNFTLARMALSGMDLSDLSLPPESIPHHE
ncbi:hypothetical protein [Novosphingobium umbonatum]|nr:hypothetical protein [Novosphingobium umbonatum]